MFDNENPEIQDQLPETDVVEEEQEIPAEEASSTIEVSEEDQEESQSEEPVRTLNKEEEKYRKKLKRLMKDKMFYVSRAQELEAENERLKQATTYSNDAAMLNYDNLVKLEVEQAKQAKRQAIEMGDIDAQIEADAALTRAIAREKELTSWKTQAALQRATNQQSQPQQQYQQPELSEEAENWLAANSWFDERSPDYDEDKATEVQAFAAALDYKLAQQGRQDEYFSPSYFKKIDNFIRNTYGDDQSNNYNNGNIPMRKSNQQVAPVRRNTQGIKAEKERIILTEDEKFLARNMGITPEQWIKAKKLTDQKQKERGMNYGRY